MIREFSVPKAVQSRNAALFARAAETQLPEEFTANLKKILKKKQGTITLHYGSSDFELRHILAKLNPEEIQAIMISTKKNHNITFFGIEIRLCYGTLILDTSYCIWQYATAFKMVHHMLVPMVLYGLSNKVLFNNEYLFENGYSSAFNQLCDWVRHNNPQGFFANIRCNPHMSGPTKLAPLQKMLEAAEGVNLNFKTLEEGKKFKYLHCPQTRKWEHYLDCVYN